MIKKKCEWIWKPRIVAVKCTNSWFQKVNGGSWEHKSRLVLMLETGTPVQFARRAMGWSHDIKREFVVSPDIKDHLTITAGDSAQLILTPGD